MNIKWDKKKFTTYLIWTFSVAWILQVIAGMFARQGNQTVFQMLLSVVMFAPMLGAVMAKLPLRGMGWKPKLKGNVRFLLAAWLMPAVFAILGAVLYFVIFPSRLDFSGDYMVATAGEIFLEQMEAQGITMQMYFVIVFVQAFTYAPWLNMFFALGEEVGWRGAMQPMLNDRFGKSKGRMIGGIIWGAWHWPVMVLAGYEYGLEYWGAPFVGMALFCLVTVVMGTLLDFVYEKTNCIWIPALGHGAFNCFATVPLMFLNTDYLDQLILGPSPIGMISVLPALVVAVLVLVKDKKCSGK